MKKNEMFALENAGKLVRPVGLEEGKTWYGGATLGRVVGYNSDPHDDFGVLVQLYNDESTPVPDEIFNNGWSLKFKDGDVVLTKQPEGEGRFLWVTDFEIEIVEQTEEKGFDLYDEDSIDAESIATGKWFVRLILIAAAVVMSLFILCGKTSAQVSVKQDVNKELATARLGNIKLVNSEGVYYVVMTDKTNSAAKSRLQLAGFDFGSGKVILALGDKEAATEVLKYLSENKPKKGEEVSIEGNPDMKISYSGLFGGWQFSEFGMTGNMSQGEAVKFLKAL